MNAKEIKSQLKRCRQKRERGDKLIAEGTEPLPALFREAQAAEGISMSEAAELAGVSRKTAYGMLAED